MSTRNTPTGSSWLETMTDGQAGPAEQGNRPGWLATPSVLLSLLLFLVGAQAVTAQSLAWAVAPSVIIDTDFTDDTQIGPGLTGEIEVNAERRLSYSAVLSLARTDFSVGADDLHRNFGAVALGLRLMAEGEGPSVGVLFGMGALFWDDLSETDSGFRSSANAEEMLLPGVELRWPIGGSLGLSFSLRDQVTGWWNAILDPSEGELSHRLMIAFGLYGW